MLSSKSHPVAKVEKNRGIFFKIGLIVALSVTLIAFKWRFYNIEKDVGIVDRIEEQEEIETVPATQFSEPTPPPPEPETDKNRTNRKIGTIKEIRQTESDDIDKSLPQLNFDANQGAGVPLPDEKVGDPVPFVAVGQEPKFPGGVSALIKFIESHINYPEMAKENNIEGVVQVGFTVDINGKVRGVHVLRSNHEIFEAEAVRVVRQLPDWRPGKQRGRKVPVEHQMVVRFELE